MSANKCDCYGVDGVHKAGCASVIDERPMCECGRCEFEHYHTAGCPTPPAPSGEATPAPWKQHEGYPNEIWEARSAGRRIAECSDRHLLPASANARLIVDAVNEREALKAERDDYKAVLEKLVRDERFETYYFYKLAKDALKKAQVTK